uniref:hypothetical protein n=1 Tax=Proteus mirabilis TaxID=584 RepID=UPI001B364692
EIIILHRGYDENTSNTDVIIKIKYDYNSEISDLSIKQTIGSYINLCVIAEILIRGNISNYQSDSPLSPSPN